jgi:hypothetical protein
MGPAYAVDHVYPFKLLVQDFLTQLGLSLEEAILYTPRNREYTWRYPELLSQWLLYHAEHAVLQMLTHEENFKKGCKYAEPTSLPQFEEVKPNSLSPLVEVKTTGETK